MTYQEALNFIHSIPRMPKKPSLDRITELMRRLGDPQEALRCIHVAGTNGKGSTCAMLSHIYTRAGYKTGLYISPFIVDFRERIQINNGMISRQDLVSEVERVRPHFEAMSAQDNTPSEFEVVAAVAFDYFRRQDCDLVILEVGMGGRFDSTNVIKNPLVSVITSIGIDHTAFLGDTLEQIAFEKCGIIKEGGVTVSYPRQEPEALGVIMEQCAARNNRLVMGANAAVLSTGLEGTDIAYDGMELRIPLLGKHQIWNAVTVVETVKASGVTVSKNHVIDGISSTVFPARMEVLCRNPLILLDGAHNRSGIQALAQAMELVAGKRVHAVVGMMEDKDAEGCLSMILPRCHTVTTTSPDIAKALPADRLANIAQRYCAAVDCVPTAAAAFTRAAARCGEGDVLLLFGSLYLAGELRPVAMAYAKRR